MEEVEVPFRPSKWQEGKTTYDDGSTRTTGRWADECQAPGCELVSPATHGPGLGWLCLAVRQPNIWLVVADEVHGNRRALVGDQLFWFCKPEHVAAWVATLRVVEQPEEVEQDAPGQEAG